MKKLYKFFNDNKIKEAKSWKDITDICYKNYAVQDFQVSTALCTSSIEKCELNETYNGLVYYIVLSNKLGDTFAVVGISNFTNEI